MKCLKISLLGTLGLLSLAMFSQQHKKQWQGNRFAGLPDYVINVRHFIGAEGEILKWRITKDNVKVIYNCDWQGCKDTLLYQSFIDTATSQTYLTAIKAIGLDSLEGNYERKSLADGLFVNFEAQNVFGKPVKFSLHGIKMKSVDAFYRITDSLVLANTRYKLKKYW